MKTMSALELDINIYCISRQQIKFTKIIATYLVDMKQNNDFIIKEQHLIVLGGTVYRPLERSCQLTMITQRFDYENELKHLLKLSVEKVDIYL